MSLQDVLSGPECGLDAYEQTNRDVWIECQTKKSRIGLMIGIPIIIIIVIVLLFVGTVPVKIMAVLGGCALIGLMVASHVYWVPMSAGTQFDMAQRELKSRMDSGMTRAEAFKSLQEERLAKLKMEQQARLQSQANAANTAGMFAIANALSGKK